MSDHAAVLTKYPFAQSVIASHSEIQAAIQRVGKELYDHYGQVVSEQNPLILICVLKGSAPFTVDLAKVLQDMGLCCLMEFLCVSSYGGGTESSGEVRMLLDLRGSIAGKHVLIVEDIIDSGRTFDFMKKLLGTRSPASLKILTLLDKPSARKIPLQADFRCFVIPNEFVIGYGLDFNELYRGMRDIVVLKPSFYQRKPDVLKRHSIPEQNSKL